MIKYILINLITMHVISIYEQQEANYSGSSTLNFKRRQSDICSL